MIHKARDAHALGDLVTETNIMLKLLLGKLKSIISTR